MAQSVQLTHKPSGRTVSLCRDACLVTDPGGREHRFESPVAQPSRTALPSAQTAPPDRNDSKHLRVLSEGIVFEIRLPFELSEGDRDLLELLFTNRRLSPDDVVNQRGRRALNRLDDLKQRLAAQGSPIIETREGIFRIAEIAPHVRRVSG